MPAGYAALPNPRSHPDEDELEAAFDASDDEDDGDLRGAESRPLNPTHRNDDHNDDDNYNGAAINYSTVRPAHSRTQSVAPGAYDFESADYDFPPPGSPPAYRGSGNSNGVIPTGPVARPRSAFAGHMGQGASWMRRVLPTRVAQRLVGGEERRRVVGGTDGVFANVTAKPTAPRQIREEDGIYVSPEDAQKETPPSYAAAQADAVPTYWETTIHAPSSLSPGMMVPGELPIEGCPTGTVFSFLWNMLVSISFQFVGFLLTTMMASTHASKLGSRAGLGLTLVQYGFAIKAGREDVSTGSGSDGTWGVTGEVPVDSVPQFDSAAQAKDWFAAHPNVTIDSSDMAVNGQGFLTSDSTSEWLAFLLMTIGWFILLNSLLGFWRIKRWERSILASHEEHPDRPPPIPLPAQTPGHARQSSFARHFERTLGLRLPNLQTAFGLDNNPNRIGGDEQLLFEYDEPEDGHDLERGPDAEQARRQEIEEEVLLSIPANHPDRERLVNEAIANERRLQEDLRAAGLL